MSWHQNMCGTVWLRLDQMRFIFSYLGADSSGVKIIPFEFHRDHGPFCTQYAIHNTLLWLCVVYPWTTAEGQGTPIENGSNTGCTGIGQIWIMSYQSTAPGSQQRTRKGSLTLKLLRIQEGLPHLKQRIPHQAVAWPLPD